MGGKGSKGSVGAAATPTPTHHRSGSSLPTPPPPSSALSPRHAAALDSKLQLLDQIYPGIAASVVLSKNGELMSACALCYLC